MILTINLNYIFEPCINLYAHLIQELPSSRQMMWDSINKQLDLPRHLSINQENLSFIKDVLSYASKHATRAAYADNHSAILTALGDEFGYNQKILPNNVINIDHFHDIGTTIEQTNAILMYDDADATSWVSYLYKYDGIKQYTWIGNANSHFISEEEQNVIPNYCQITKENFDYSLLDNCDFIFVSGASSWVPPQYDNYLIEIQQLLIELFDAQNLKFYSDTFNQAKQYQNFACFKN